MEDNGTSSSQTVDSSVCDVCQGFGDLNSPRAIVVETVEKFREQGRYLYIYMHHPNFRTLQESVEGGCDICTAILDTLRSYGEIPNEFAATSSWAQSTAGPQPKSAEPVAQFGDNTLIATRLAELAKQDYSKQVKDEMISMKVYCDEKTGPRWSGIWVDPIRVYIGVSEEPSISMAYFNTPCDPLDPMLEDRPARDLLSKPHIDLINRWMNTCKDTHLCCRRIGCKKQLPNRVIELLDSSNEDRGIRLVETQGKMQGTYACLSYCWGDPESQTGQVTTRSNLSSQLQGISYQDLPYTIVDTIRLCYKLGFRFLWIDRLCIIQDDESDWSAEASRMCDTYSNSTLTISVPICSRASQSFLAERSKGFQDRELFWAVTYTDQESKLRGSLWINKDSVLMNSSYWFLEVDWATYFLRQNLGGHHWSNRGWTFQEWMLSPRLLHIDNMTLWDCFDGYANELNRRQIDKVRLPRDSQQFGTKVLWIRIVEEYSKRKVTHQKDRMPALAGLAARYGQVTGYTYLAGLWVEEMPFSLLWQCRSGCAVSDTLQRANPTVPSWSWACSDGGVYYPEFFLQLRSNLNSFTAKASIVSYSHHNRLDSISSVEKPWVDVKGYCSVAERLYPNGEISRGHEWWHTAKDDGKNFTDDEIAQESIFLLLIGVSKKTSLTDHVALLLKQCGLNDGQPCFRRLGRAVSVNTFPAGLGPSWQQRTLRLI